SFVKEAGMEKVWGALADSVGRLNRGGGYHTDLNLKKILVRGEAAGVEKYIIHFYRTGLFLGWVPPRLAGRNLHLLVRSVCKLDPVRKYVSETDWNRFVAWYHGAG